MSPELEKKAQAIQRVVNFFNNTAPGHVLGRSLGGAALGGLWGNQVSPRVGGYDDDTTSTWLSTVGGVLGGALLANRGHRMQGVGALTTGELLPVGIKMLHGVTDSMDAQGAAAIESNQALRDAANTEAKARVATSMNGQLSDIFTSDAAKGVGVGTGVAGLGAILTGLMRGKTEGEMRDNTSRLGMVANDFATYVLPAAIAGGVLNHYKD